MARDREWPTRGRNFGRTLGPLNRTPSSIYRSRFLLRLPKIALVARTPTLLHPILIILLRLPNMSSLQGRVYTITGAASGIGQAVAVRLAELGAAGLALSDVNLKGLEETKNKCKNSLPTRNTARLHT